MAELLAGEVVAVVLAPVRLGKGDWQCLLKSSLASA